MKQEEIVEILTKTGCLNEDGCDKPVINSMKLLEDPIVTNRLAVELLQQLPNDTKLDTILCLHNDEMLFAYSVATAAWARFVSVEVTDGKVSFLNGSDVVKGNKVLIVDDVLDDDSEIAALVTEIEKREAKVIGVTSLFSFVDAQESGVTTYSLLSY